MLSQRVGEHSHVFAQILRVLRPLCMPITPLGRCAGFIPRCTMRELTAMKSLEVPRWPNFERTADELVHALDDVAGGQVDRARQRLKEVWMGTTRRRNPKLDSMQKLRILFRDRFTCRYCGRHTIWAPCRRLLFEKTGVPWHAHSRSGETDASWWRDVANVDHVHPVSRPGTGDGPDNLVTSCTPCNYAKLGFTPEELGWPILDVTTEFWDGGVRAFVLILERDREMANRPHYRRDLRRVRRLLAEIPKHEAADYLSTA